MSRTDQLKYLKAHPRSKLKPKRAPIKKGKKGAKAPVRRKKSAGVPQEELRKAGEESPQKDQKSASTVVEQEVRAIGAAQIDATAKEMEDKYIPVRAELRPKDKKAVLEAVGKNKDTVRDILNKKLEQQKENAAQFVDDMSPKELSKLGMIIKRGVEKESGKDLFIAAGIVLGKAGLVVAGLGIATAVGITPAVFLLGLFNYRHTINNFADGKLRNTVTDFVTGVYEGMQDGLKDFTNVRDNLVANKPDTVLSEEDDRRESASAPAHMSDVVKSLSSLSKKDYSRAIERASQQKLIWAQANDLLTTLYAIEFDLRKLNQLYMRFRLSKEQTHLSRSIIQIKELTSKHHAVQQALFTLAAKQPDDGTLETARQFGKLLSSKEILRTYILDDGQLTLCWVILAENIRATNSLMPKVQVYIACTPALKVAVSMNSTITPKHMQTYDKKLRPHAIMYEYGLT